MIASRYISAYVLQLIFIYYWIYLPSLFLFVWCHSFCFVQHCDTILTVLSVWRPFYCNIPSSWLERTVDGTSDTHWKSRLIVVAVDSQRAYLECLRSGNLLSSNLFNFSSPFFHFLYFWMRRGGRNISAK